MNFKAFCKQMTAHGLTAAIGGALFLSACAKTSGSFNALQANQPLAHAQTGESPTASATPSPSGGDEKFRSKLVIQPAPSAPPEFKFDTPPSPLESNHRDNQQSFERYMSMNAQKVENPTPEEVISRYPLAWETKSRPERKNWSDYTLKVIEAQFSNLDQATDAVVFCPNYTLLEEKYKLIVWGMLISEIALHESSWNPTTRSKEGTMGVDGVTKDQVYSEGLMQLSYQDTQWSSYCRFDWSKDKLLSPKDPRKTILNPYLNLSCGIRILAEQVARKKKIVLKNDIYWSVLHEGGKFSKVPEMAKDIRKRLDFCN